MRIGILESGEVPGHLREVHGDYAAMFAHLLSSADPDLDFATVSVVRGEMPMDPDEADGWLVTGSRHGVYDDLPWIAPLEQFLRDCLAREVPVVGVCFGHQILASAMGGRVEKSGRGWGVGVHDYDVVHRPSWMRDLPERIAVRAIHQDQVMEKPADAVVLARSAFCPYAALAYGDPERPRALSVQPHPEFTAEFVDALLAARSGIAMPEPVAAAGRASLERPVHAEEWARWIVDYFRLARAARAAA